MVFGMKYKRVVYGLAGALVVGLLAAIALLMGTERILAVGANSGGAGRRTPTDAAGLRLVAANLNNKASALLDPLSLAWSAAKPTAILLNLTPRIYDTDVRASTTQPNAWVKSVRTQNDTVILLTWTDSTKDQPRVVSSSPADLGSKVRVIPSELTNRFYDGAAVMIPQNRLPLANPTLMMGDALDPVDIYFWHSIRGPRLMRASGRATTEWTKKTFPSKTVYSDGKWRVTFVMPKLPVGTPVAFAIWDGSQGQRGGLKYFSVWHSLR